MAPEELRLNSRVSFLVPGCVVAVLREALKRRGGYVVMQFAPGMTMEKVLEQIERRQVQVAAGAYRRRIEQGGG